MRILVVGGAGHVASIVRPALEAAHEVTYFDRVPVAGLPRIPGVSGAPGRKCRTIVGDVLDEAAVRRAVRRQRAIVYLALGAEKKIVRGKPFRDYESTDIAFRVNVAGWYQFCRLGLEAGVGRLIYASSSSVYRSEISVGYVRDESDPADAFYPYGFSKRCGEYVCAGTAQSHPRAVVVSLRLYLPSTQTQYAQAVQTHRHDGPLLHLGPRDTCRLFLQALKLRRPGFHAIQATGDRRQQFFSHARAKELLRWEPRGQ